MATRKRDIKQAQLFCLMDQAEGINYFAQDANDNQGGLWKNMENEWAAVIQGTRYPANTNLPVIIPAVAGGQTVTRVIIEPQFNGTKRPFRFDVDFTYGTTSQPQRQILNP